MWNTAIKVEWLIAKRALQALERGMRSDAGENISFAHGVRAVRNHRGFRPVFEYGGKKRLWLLGLLPAGRKGLCAVPGKGIPAAAAPRQAVRSAPALRQKKRASLSGQKTVAEKGALCRDLLWDRSVLLSQLLCLGRQRQRDRPAQRQASAGSGKEQRCVSGGLEKGLYPQAGGPQHHFRSAGAEMGRCKYQRLLCRGSRWRKREKTRDHR